MAEWCAVRRGRARCGMAGQGEARKPTRSNSTIDRVALQKFWIMDESLKMTVFGLLMNYSVLNVLETMHLLIERDRLFTGTENPVLTELIQSLGKSIAVAESLTDWEIS
jgi:hypothetical protein